MKNLVGFRGNLMNYSVLSLVNNTMGKTCTVPAPLERPVQVPRNRCRTSILLRAEPRSPGRMAYRFSAFPTGISIPRTITLPLRTGSPLHTRPITNISITSNERGECLGFGGTIPVLDLLDICIRSNPPYSGTSPNAFILYSVRRTDLKRFPVLRTMRNPG